MNRVKGILIGSALALLFIVVIENTCKKSTQSEYNNAQKLNSDCNGSISHIVIQYVKEAKSISAKAYRDFISQLPQEIQISLICSTQEDFNNFLKATGLKKERFRKLVVSHDITCWSRDRWLALDEGKSNSKITLLVPYRENGMERWDERLGDAKLAYDIENAYEKRIRVEKSNLLFDGGDFVSDSETVFVSPHILIRNPGLNRTQIEKILEKQFGKKIVILEGAPEHHAGMYMMAIGKKHLIVGDPKMAIEIIKSQKDIEYDKLLKLIPKNLDELQKSFDSIAETCKQHGYEIIRIPVLPYNDLRTYITPLNVILNKENSRDVVYMPTFKEADILNDYSQKIWEKAGYTVKRVDCSSSYKYSGSLRCLVNILERD